MSQNYENPSNYGGGFKDYLRYNRNQAALDYIAQQEAAGHKLTIKGGGCIASVDVDSIYSYNVFENDANKALYISKLETSTDIGNSAVVVLAYCIQNCAAHFVVKGDSIQAVRGYVSVINELFYKEYDGGKKTVGYPFRPQIRFNQVQTKNGILAELARVYNYEGLQYPFNSYRYIMAGNSMANMVLGIELDLIRPDDFSAAISSHLGAGAYDSVEFVREKFKDVYKDMQARYLLDTTSSKENTVALVLGETCARTHTMYKKVAKKMHLYKGRHDLVVTTVASFIMRRKYDYDQTTTMLQLGTENMSQLAVEVFIEINRLTKYSYEYIIRNIMKINDSDYDLLVTAFKYLHRDRNNNFAELCEKFSVRNDVVKIRAYCDF